MKKNIFIEAIEGEESGTADGAKKGWETRKSGDIASNPNSARARAKARGDAQLKKNRDAQIAFSKRSTAIKKGIQNKAQRDAWSDHIRSLSKASTAIRRGKQTEAGQEKGGFKFFGEECFKKAKK